MAIGDQYQRISPQDRWIFDAAGNLVGVQTPHALGNEGRFLATAQAAALAYGFPGSLTIGAGQSLTTRQANTTALQAQLTAGALHLLTPGIYEIDDSLLYGSDTVIELGAGVEVRTGGTGGRNVFRTSNAAWSALDNHTLACVTILCASPGQSGVGSVSYVYAANNPIASQTVAYGATNFANVSATLAYKSPSDSAYGTPVSIPGFPGGKVKLVSANGVDTLWVSVGNGGKAGSQAALAQSWLPATNVVERVNLVNIPRAAPSAVTWSVSTQAGVTVVTVYEPGNTRQAGDKVEFLKGSGLEGLFEVFALGNEVGYGTNSQANTTAWKDQNGSIKAGYWTFLPNTAVNASYWSGLGSSGSAYVWGLRNITWRGRGKVNYYQAGKSSLPADNMGSCAWMNGVSDYRISGVAFVDGYSHCHFQTNVCKGKVEQGEGFFPYGAINLRGPVRAVEVINARGQSHDNNSDLGTTDYGNFIVHFPYENCSSRFSSATDVWDNLMQRGNDDQAMEVTRLFVTAGTYSLGTTLVGYYGASVEQATACIKLLADEACLPNITPTAAAALAGAAGASGAGGYFDDLKIINNSMKESPFKPMPHITFSSLLTNVGTVLLDCPDVSQQSGSGTIAVQGAMDHLIIRMPKRREAGRAAVGGGAFSGYLGYTDNGATLNRLTIQNAAMNIDTTLGSSGIWLCNPTGVMGSIDLEDCWMQDANWKATALAVSNGGTGYNVGDAFKIDITGTGRGSANITGTVATVSGSTVLTVTLVAAGVVYNNKRPTSPAATVATSGTGTGLTLTPTWQLGVKTSTYGIFNNGKIGRINIRGGSWLALDALVFSQTSVASGNPTVNINGAYFLNGNYVISSSSTVAFGALTLQGLTGNLFQVWSISHTSGNVHASLFGCKGLSIGSAAVSAQSGGGTVTVTSPDFALDITQTGFTKTTAGQMVLTKALAGTIPAGRLAVTNGTNWKCVDDTTLVY